MLKMVKLLLDRGARVDLKNQLGHSILMIACMNGEFNIAKLLLEKGAQIDARSNDGLTGEILPRVPPQYGQLPPPP